MRHASSLHLLLVLAVTGLLRSQSPTWTMRSASPSAMEVNGGSMVYDIARGRIVLVAADINGVGVMNTWEWDGRHWWMMQPAVVPPLRLGAALAFDALRARTVMFGGPTNDTWEWDGVAWLQCSTATAPSPRYYPRMAFDLVRGRTLLFGGNSSAYSDETWEWDGVSWTQRLPATRPVGRREHGMAYDLWRNRIVMFGGVGVTGYLGDTWEWDGANWTRRFPLHSPSAGLPTMTSNLVSGRTLLFAGTTWTWDGIDWTQLSRPVTPSINYQRAALAFDVGRQSAVLHGAVSGSGGGSPVTWEWDGNAWAEVRPGPVARAFSAMAYADQRGSALLFGGASGLTTYGDAWEWDGTCWSERTWASGPGPRSDAKMVYDSLRDRYVLFGGGSQVALGDTWELDRTNWVLRVTSPSPAARFAHAMAFDTGRRRVVLFAGNSASGSRLDDTWEWDGSSWTQCAPPAPPSPRFGHAMTFDPLRRRVLLFSGTTPSGFVNDTWEWEGSSWQQRTASTVPPARGGHVMMWDAGRGRAVVYGGRNGYQLFADTWEWDGVTWTQATPATSPSAIVFAAAAYDSQRGAHVVFGGLRTTSFAQGEVWEYAAPGFAIASTFGQGCGTPPLTASPAAGSRPILGATQTVDIGNVPAGFAAMAYGFSMTALGATPLPLDLGSIGMTGCSVLQSCDSLFEACASSGPSTATYSASVPNVASLLSLRLWLQAWAPAPGQNPAGLIASNAVSLLLGGR